MKKSYILSTFVLIFLAFTSCYGCASSSTQADSGAESETKSEEEMKSNSQSQNTSLKMSIGGTEVQVDWEENESVAALKNPAAEKNPLEIQMSMYGGFEQVGRVCRETIAKPRQVQAKCGTCFQTAML